VSQYRYEIIDNEDQPVSGIVDAGSLADAADQVEREFPRSEVLSMELVEANRRFEPTGPRPPAAPRDIDVKLTSVGGGLVLLLVGALFAGVASILILVGLGLLISGNDGGLFMTLFPMIHLAIGVGMLWYVFSRRARQQRLYRDGEATMATIEEEGPHPTMKINGRRPTLTSWSFEHEGTSYHGKRTSTPGQGGAGENRPGDAIWVLYDPADPSQSVSWPPPT